MPTSSGFGRVFHSERHSVRMVVGGVLTPASGQLNVHGLEGGFIGNSARGPLGLRSTGHRTFLGG